MTITRPTDMGNVVHATAQAIDQLEQLFASGSGGGTGGSDANYVHTQSILASTWTVVHNLGKYGSVSIVDSGGSVILADVTYNSVNQVTLTFATAISGKAYIN